MENGTKLELIANEIKKKIWSKEYKYGTKIPTERQLASEYNVSRSTIRNAIIKLEKNNYITKIKNIGTYVSKNVNKDLQIYFKGMSEILADSGIKPSTIIINTDKVKAGHQLSRVFNINSDDYLFRIIRLRLGNKNAISIEYTYTPYNCIDDIELINFELFSFYNILAANLHQINKITHIISSIIIRGNEAKLLNLDDGEAVVSVNITSSTKSGEIVEHTKVLVVPEFSYLYTENYVMEGVSTVNAQKL